MDKIIRLITATLLGVAIAACSDIDVADRYIELPPVEAQRVVLLEEFTGQKCVNCPEGHQIITDLCTQYPDNLVPVCIHAGGDAWSFAEAEGSNAGLRNEYSQALGESYGVVEFPAGVIDRNSGLQLKEKWASSVYSAIKKPALVEIAAKAKIGDGKIVVDVDILPHENMDGRIHVWLTENNIRTIQQTPSGFQFDYIHNHVLRHCAGGIDGTALKLTTRQAAQFTAEIPMKDKWVASELQVVVFYATKAGVEQTAVCKPN